jgi:hypothetical protein
MASCDARRLTGVRGVNRVRMQFKVRRTILNRIGNPSKTRAVNRRVVSSNPTRGAKEITVSNSTLCGRPEIQHHSILGDTRRFLLEHLFGRRQRRRRPRDRQVSLKDFERISWKADPHGNSLAELDKSDPRRTHVSDAVGYLIAGKFGMRMLAGERVGPILC